MNRVISYSLFGDSLLYRRGLPALIRIASVIFPGWIIRIYHNGDIDKGWYSGVLLELAEHGVIQLIKVSEPIQLCRAMLWRMLPIWDPDIEYVICRDIDALLLPKDRIAVEQFIESNSIAHSINDHPMHGVLMMGGMIGFQCARFIQVTGYTTWEQFIEAGSYTPEKWAIKGADQDYLSEYVWPKIKSFACVHRLQGMPLTEGTLKSYTDIRSDNTYDIPREVIDIGNLLAPFMGIHRFNPIECMMFYDRYMNVGLSKYIRHLEEKHNVDFNIIATYQTPD